MVDSPVTHPVALVTGGTRGIGLGVCRALAREGWALAVCGVRPEAAVQDVVAELREHGPAEYIRADVASPVDRARLVDETVGRLGRIAALVNNAGQAPRVRADLLEASEESFEALVRTNLQGPYFLTQAVARRLIDRRNMAAAAPREAPSDTVPGTMPGMVPGTRGGGIVFITSVSAEMASTNRGEYCVSKAGLAMAVKLFAVRLAPHGVPVYEVRPGIIATDMTAGVKDAYDARIAQGLLPEGRWGTPDDVGRVVAALLRGDVPYATGTVIHVDGGLTLSRL
jgi:NAD(P)-dependent dehydrogenase (short-subunit alcohol dehydrogenase family)